jgi:hypothetical protein
VGAIDKKKDFDRVVGEEMKVNGLDLNSVIHTENRWYGIGA